MIGTTDDEESALGSLLSRCRQNLHSSGSLSLRQLVPVHQTLCQCMASHEKGHILPSLEEITNSLDTILKSRCSVNEIDVYRRILLNETEMDRQHLATSKDSERLLILQYLMFRLSLLDALRYVIIPYLLLCQNSVSDDLELSLLEAMDIPALDIAESKEWQETLDALVACANPSASRILVRILNRKPHFPLLIRSLYEKVWRSVLTVRADPSVTFQNHPTLSTLSKELLPLLTNEDVMANLDLHQEHLCRLWTRLFDEIWLSAASESLHVQRIVMLVITTVLCPLLPHVLFLELPRGNEMLPPAQHSVVWDLSYACVSQGTSALDDNKMSSMSSILRRRGLFLLNTIADSDEWKQYVMCYETLEMEQEQHLVDQIWGFLGNLFDKVSDDPKAPQHILTWKWMSQLFGCVLSASLPVVQKRSMYRVLKAHIGDDSPVTKGKKPTQRAGLRATSFLDKMPPDFMLRILLPSWNSLSKSVGFTFNLTLENGKKERIDMVPMMKQVLQSYIGELDSVRAEAFWRGIWDWSLIQHFNTKTFIFVFEALAEKLKSNAARVELPVGDSEFTALMHTLKSLFSSNSVVITNRRSIMEHVSIMLAHARPVAFESWSAVVALRFASLYKQEFFDLETSREWNITDEPMLMNLKLWFERNDRNLSDICPVLASAFVDGELGLSSNRAWDPENGANDLERELAWGIVLLASLVAEGSLRLTASQFLWPAINKGLSRAGGAMMTSSYDRADHVARALLLLQSGCLLRQLSGLGNGDLIVLDRTTQQLMPVPPNIETILSSAIDFDLFHTRILLNVDANDGTNGAMQTSLTYSHIVSQVRTLHQSFPSSEVVRRAMVSILESSSDAIADGGDDDWHRVTHAMLIYAALSSGADLAKDRYIPLGRAIVGLSLTGDTRDRSKTWEHMARSVLYYAKWASISKILPLVGIDMTNESQSFRSEAREFIEWILAECFDVISAALQDAVVPVFNCVLEAARLWFDFEDDKDNAATVYIDTWQKIVQCLISLMKDAPTSHEGVYMLNQLCSLIFQPRFMGEEYERFRTDCCTRTPIRDGFRALMMLAGVERDHIRRAVLCKATVGWLGTDYLEKGSLGLNAIPYRDDLVDLLIHKGVRKDEAASNQHRSQTIDGMEIPVETNPLSLARAFVLVFIEKLPAIDDGLNPLVLSELVEPLIRQLLAKAEPTKSSKPSLIMKGTPLYCQKMRAWQSLCNLARFITPDVAPRVCEAAFTCLEESIHSEVRYFVEVFTVRCGVNHPMVFGNSFLNHIVQTNLSLQQVASLMILGGNWIVGRYKLDFFNPLTSAGEQRIRTVLSGAIPWLSSTQGFSRAIAQLLVHHVIPLVVDVKNANQTSLDNDGVLRLIYKFLNENREMARLRRKQAKFFETYDVESVCSVRGVLSIPVDEGDEAEPVHLVNVIKQTLIEVYEEAHTSDVPQWKQVEEILAARNVEANEDSDIVNFQRKIIPIDALNLAMESQREIKLRNAAGKRKQQLVVCASLIDKLPNLAGLARTVEIFAADRFVVPDKSLCKMDEFQSISVGAGDWIDIEQVKPEVLLPWLLEQKANGYYIFGLEQTASSVSLETMEFPDQPTILLLGREKEGIPVELLQAVDQCVEIPQLGIIRSLNVHVSGAIAIWEVTKQRIQRNESKVS